MSIDNYWDFFSRSYPRWLKDHMCYETLTGSQAYGTFHDESDMDIVGVYIPPVEDMFPHLKGNVVGFDSPYKPYKFKSDTIQEFGVDYTPYNITEFFRLCMNANPNVLETLFTPEGVLISNEVGEHIRNNRHLFLSKKIATTYLGFAKSCYKKVKESEFKRLGAFEGTTRYENIKKYGFDTKALLHHVRVLLYGWQLLREQDLDMEEIHLEHEEDFKSIQEGLVRIEDFRILENVIKFTEEQSTLPDEPNYMNIKKLLLECIEMDRYSLKEYE